MKLTKVALQGYKRFRNSSTMNVDGKIVAVVGPNESGKSSFLKALQHLNQKKPFIVSGSSQELTREENIDPNQKIIEATFLLDENDKNALAHIPEAAPVQWIKLFQKKDGAIWMSQVSHSNRNLGPRKSVVEALNNLLNVERSADMNSNMITWTDSVKALISQLDVNDETLPKDLLTKVRQLSPVMQNVITDEDPESVKNLPQQLLDLAAHEEKENPSQLSANVLFNRIPQILFFGADARLLNSEYTLDKPADSYPTSLRNLARVAKLSLNEVIHAISVKDYGKLETLVEQANKTLVETFAANWSQSGITIRLRIDENILRILVRDSGTTYVPIAERSDGLRQFVALIAFVTVEASDIPPILLIDEAEIHLHYDAQADLVQMFAKQDIAAKVIYTTHSIGCLPEDLGTGIRLIEAHNDGSSTIRNWFWDTNRQGFSPLLFGMGARTLAFIPIRFALLTEGATDIILLPTLLREATNRAFLGFQVVPGLSSASEDEIALLEHESPRTAYLADSDKGGDDIRRKLRRAGITKERILKLPDARGQGLVVEDYVNPAIYINAINEELKRSHGTGFTMKSEELTDANKPKTVKEWCREKGVEQPNKRAVAYRILEFNSEHPDKLLLDERHRASFQQLYQDIETALKMRVP